MIETRICPICGKEFIPRPNQKYCSPGCKSTNYYRELEARKNKIESLEKEADWLADRCANNDCPHGCPSEEPPSLEECKDCCREAARKAVEEENANS